MAQNDEYARARKQGERAYRRAVISGEYPYLPALEEILWDRSSDIGTSLGIMDIPLDQVVGTKTRGRQAAFARNFMPLLDGDSEFAGKWSFLIKAQKEEGIRDPVKVYEYMWNFYVLEGNKRVSVLKYLDLPTILADVIRVMPIPSEEKDIKIYMEFDRFFRVMPIYDLIFSEEGDYEKLAEAVGQDLNEPWSEDVRKSFLYAYERFTTVFEARFKQSLSLTNADAFLVYLGIYKYESLMEDSKEIILKKIEKIRDEFVLEAGGNQISFSEQPETKDAGALPGLFKPKTYTEKNPLQIAFFYDGKLSESSWLYGHELGRNHISEVFGDVVKTWSYESTLEEEDFAAALKDAVEKNAHVIVTTSPILMEPALRAAVEYPQVRVLNCSINLSQGAVRTYYGRMHEAKFLMGVLAGSLCEDHKIGYVADYPIYGAVSRINAFAIGAALSDPQAKVYLTWTSLAEGDWKTYMQENGVHIVSGPDLIKPKEASREYGLYRMNGGEVTNLAMPVWNWGTYYELIVRGILDGKFQKDNSAGTTGQALNLWWGMSAGVIDVILSKNLSFYSGKMIDIYRKALINDTFRPFDGTLKDNRGTVRGDHDSVLSNEEIVAMNWLNDNVIGEIPDSELLNEAGKKAIRVSGLQIDHAKTAENAGAETTG
jgi:basic membrane lipoprotein Med (substrate-binding protein (PBP1-ABC) superfamily)